MLRLRRLPLQLHFFELADVVVGVGSPVHFPLATAPALATGLFLAGEGGDGDAAGVSFGAAALGVVGTATRPS